MLEAGDKPTVFAVSYIGNPRIGDFESLFGAPRCQTEEVQFLYILDIIFLPEFFIVLPYVIHGQLPVQPVQDALHLILGGPFTLLFWGAFVALARYFHWLSSCMSLHLRCYAGRPFSSTE